MFEFEPRPDKSAAKKAAGQEGCGQEDDGQRRVTPAVAIKLLAVLVTAAIGYLAGRMRWLTIGAAGSDAARVLSNAAFYVFVPALLFRTTARLDFAHHAVAHRRRLLRSGAGSRP